MRSKHITRKEIAAANEVSDDTIARREKQIGLDRCRSRVRARPISYNRIQAAEALRAAGYEVPAE